MNLLSLAKKGWAAAADEIHVVADYVRGHTSPTSQAQVAASVTTVKQATSDVITAVDTSTGAVLGAAANDFEALFNKAVLALGYSVNPTVGTGVAFVERVLQPYEEDGLNWLRDFLVGQAHALTLQVQAKLAGHGAQTGGASTTAALAASNSLSGGAGKDVINDPTKSA